MKRNAADYLFFVSPEGECFRYGSDKALPNDAELTPPEQALLNKLKEQGKIIGPHAAGRFRVYGSIDRNAEENFIHQEIVLTTEFCADESDNGFWNPLGDLAHRTGAGWWTMDSRQVQNGMGVDCIEKQVELSWRVEGLPRHIFEELYEYLRTQTERAWQIGGVGVC